MPKWVKKIITGLICVVLLFFGLFLITPAILSTERANQQLLGVINEKIPGHLHVRSFSLSWFGTQQINGLVLQDPNGETVLSFESFETDTPLLTILREGFIGESTKITSLSTTIKKSPNGQTNLHESLGIDIPNFQFTTPHSLAFTNVSIDFQYPTSPGKKKLIKAQGTTQHGNILGRFNIDLNWSDQESRWVADVKDFPIGILSGIISQKNPEIALLIHPLIGDAMNLQIREEAKGDSIILLVEADSKNLKIFCEGVIEEGEFKLQSPVKLHFTLTPSALTHLTRYQPSLKNWNLESSTEAILTINDFQIPTEFFSTGIPEESKERLVLNADLSLPKAQLINPQKERFKVSDIALRIETPKHSKWLTVESDGAAFYDNTPVNYAFQTKIKMPTSCRQLMCVLCQPETIKLEFNEVPSAVLDDLLGSQGRFAKAFGHAINFTMHNSNDNPNRLILSLSSENVVIPELFMDITNQHNWSGVITGPKIVLKKSRSELQSLTVPWKTRNGLREITFDFSANTPESGQLKGKGSVNNGKIDINVDGDHVPVQFLELLSGRTELGAILGTVADVDIRAQFNNWQGNVRANLKGNKGFLTFDGKIADNILYLNQPFEIVAQDVGLIGKEVLSQFAPVFNQLISSEGSLKLKISPENFSLPLFPLHLHKIEAGSITLELGKLTFSNAGDVKELVSALRPARSDKITVWTTPLYMKIHQGKLVVYRMDMLIMNRYPMATWGTIDFVRDEVNMVLGVTGTALSQALEIDGLRKDAMLQIPVRGSMGNAKIDNGKLTSKVGALIAQSSGVPEGLVIGTFLDIFNGKEGKVPKPTTSPLPWGDLDPPERRSITTEKDPMKEIQNEASNLLKGLFK